MLRPLCALPLLVALLPAQRVPEAVEPNDSTATATQLLCGQEAVGTLSSSTDQDWFRFTLAASTDLSIETGPTLTGEVGDTRLVLLDADGAPLRSNEDGPLSGYYAQLYAPALAAGTYYVIVERGAVGVTSGDYLLDLRCRPASVPAVGGVIAEAGGNNDPRNGGVAQSVFAPARIDGSLDSVGFDGDWDFYRVLLFGDGVLHARLDGTALHPGQNVAADVVFYLFDGATPPNVLAGPFHASDRDAYDAPQSFRLPGGIYQVAVRGFGGSQSGSYYLDLSSSVAARATVHAGGCNGRALGLGVANSGPGAPRTLEVPQIGTTMSLEGSNLDAFGLALHVVGFNATSIDLTVFGAPGCTLEVDYVDLAFALADATGRASWTIPLPETASVLGATIESQAAVLDGSNGLGITLSNRVSCLVGQ